MNRFAPSRITISAPVHNLPGSSLGGFADTKRYGKHGWTIKKQQGFSLIELLVVVVIILIIAVIAIPSLLRSRVSANESSAVASLRTINTAEATYSSSWGSGYAPTIDNLGGPGPCLAGTAAAACIIDSQLSLAPYVKSGYTFAAVGNTLVGAINNGYESNATPTAVDVSGKRAFCSDQTGVIRANTSGAAIGTGAGSCGEVATVAGVSGPISN